MAKSPQAGPAAGEGPLPGHHLETNQHLAKGQARLAANPYANDRGECLPATAHLLASLLPSDSTSPSAALSVTPSSQTGLGSDAGVGATGVGSTGAASNGTDSHGAGRDWLEELREIGRIQEELTAALARERVLIPAPLHAAPAPGDDPDEPCPPTDLVTIEGPSGPALAAFSSVEAIARWDKQARPVPLSAQRLALAALATPFARIIFDPGTAAIELGSPALNALGTGGSWLAPWQDTELRHGVAQQLQSLPQALRLEHFLPARAGGVVLVVGLASAIGDPARALGDAAAALAQNQRLGAAISTLELRPQRID